MVIHFCRAALVGRADRMGDYTHRAVVAWLAENWDGSEDMFWEVDPDFAERNRLKIEEECMDMAIRAMLLHVRDCPSLRLFLTRRIDEELRRESLRTDRIPDVDSYSLEHVRYTDTWKEHIDLLPAGGDAHRCTDGDWTMRGGCMVLRCDAARELADVLAGRRPLSDVPKGDYCEINENENENENEKDNGKEVDQ